LRKTKYMKPILTFIEKNRYTTLLISLVVMILLPFFFEGPGQQVLSSICMSLVFIIAVEAVSTRRRFLIFGIIIAAILISFEWLLFFIKEEHSLRIVAYIFIFCFMSFIISRLVKAIMGNKKVDREIIMAAISIYLILGVLGALLAGIIDVVYPEAYTISTEGSGLLWVNFLYYSFVTMTTLGYGDIVPIMEESKALSFMLAIIGQFYIAIIMAILVAKLISQSDKNSQ